MRFLRLAHVASVCLLSVALTACPGPPPDEPDGAALTDTDAGVADAGGDDAGLADSGAADSGSPSGSFDAGPFDGGAADAGHRDAGRPDAGHDAGLADAGARDAGRPDAGPACAVTVCLTGAVNQASGSNAGFTTLCDDPRVPGVLQDCDLGTCYNTFDTFPSVDSKTIYQRVFDAMDSNHDGQVNATDAQCELNIVGFSWGGVNAVELATRYLADPKVATARTVARLAVLDAYQPLVTSLSVPARVNKTVAFRHSVAPLSDCSRGVLLGPYLGAPIRCVAGQACTDYDYSASPTTTFATFYLGSSVGHCDVPTVATEPTIDFLTGQPLRDVPATVPVSPP